MLALSALPLLSAALIAPLASQAVTTTKGPPRVSTGGAGHVRGSSATLEGAINPRGALTSYYFQYGPTIAYGGQTATASLPAGTTTVKVGQAVSGLQGGYHYRLVASNSFGLRDGRDRTFGTKANRSTLEISREKGEPPTVYGSPYVLSGVLSGPGNANRSLVLQASPYPYHTAFATVGVLTFTNDVGRFSFRVPSLTTSTQFRVSTLDPRPTYSPTVTQQVAVQVTLKLRTTSHKGLVRLYGTVTPAEVGARVSFQLRKAVRPGKSEKLTRFATEFSTVVKRGTKKISRFSVVVRVSHGGRYRAFVQLRKGALVSGSSSTVVLSAVPTSSKPKKH